MTRNEEIKQAEIKYSNDTLFDGCDYIGQVAKQEAFIAGAKWADKAMIDKACDMLYAMLTTQDINDYYYVTAPAYDNVVNFVEDFRKAIEK